MIAGVATLLAATALAGTDVETLERLWPGVHDSAEQVFMGAGTNVTAWGQGAERRVRTVVTRVDAAWLGPHVLYLEEFLHDDPDNVRRQLLLLLEPGAPGAGVHVRVFYFRAPRRWTHLGRRPRLLPLLTRAQVQEATGCDLVLNRDGEQFSGGTVGSNCVDTRAAGRRYVEFQLVVGPELYWYRRRVLLRGSDDLQEEVLGFNWFEFNEARLFTCRIDWSASGRRSELRPLLRTELHDQGGHSRFETPDGRQLELTLHSQDWPYATERDALILLLQAQDASMASVPLASAWAEIDSDDIAIDLGWLRIRCGSLLPNADAVLAAR